MSASCMEVEDGLADLDLPTDEVMQKVHELLLSDARGQLTSRSGWVYSGITDHGP